MTENAVADAEMRDDYMEDEEEDEVVAEFDICLAGSLKD